MNIKLELHYIESKTAQSDWWLQSNFIEFLIDKCYKSDLLNIKYTNGDIKHIAIDKLVKSPEIYKQHLSTSAYGTSFELTESTKSDSNKAHFYFGDNEFNFEIELKFEEGTHQVENLILLVQNIYNNYKNELLFSPFINIRFQYGEVDFARQRPIRNYRWLEEQAIVNFILPKHFDIYFNRKPNLNLEGYKSLVNNELPSSTIRNHRDDLYTIQWIHNLQERDIIEKELINREAFIYKYIKLEPHPDFNEFGDENIFPISQFSKAPKEEKFFNYFYKDIAAKLIVLNQDKKIDSETMELLIKAIKEKTSSSEKNFNRIILILPSRETALLAEKQTQDIGIYKTVYLDNETNIWDMHPKGNWVIE